MSAMISALLNAPLLFFVLGALSRMARSDLRIPRALSKTLSIYLLAGIGLHGGAQLASAGLASLLAPAAAALALACLIPLAAYAALRYLLRLDGFNAAAIAAHYGSVSVATFMAATAWLQSRNVDYEPALVLMLAIMEVPAILIGLYLAERCRGSGSTGATAWSAIPASMLRHGSVLLLVGTILIGAVASSASLDAVNPFFEKLFMGALCLFLIDLGIQAATRLGELKTSALPLALFGVLAPLVFGSAGLLVGHAVLGFGAGGTTLVAVLAASASYIAVPPAMRMGVPEANPALYLMLSLGVTFPFNLMFGIPLFNHLAEWISK